MLLYRGQRVPWTAICVGWMASVYIWAALTPAILWAGRRWPLDGERRGALASRRGPCWPVAAVVGRCVGRRGAAAGRARRIRRSPAMSWRALVPVLLAYSFHAGVIRYWAVVVIQALLRSRQRRVGARARGARAAGRSHRAGAAADRLAAERPEDAAAAPLPVQHAGRHHGARAAARTRGEAEAMLARLSDLLRLVVDECDTQEVPLWRELEFLRLYLSIEEVRFQDRLRVRISDRCRVSGRAWCRTWCSSRSSRTPSATGSVRAKRPSASHRGARGRTDAWCSPCQTTGPGSADGARIDGRASG